MKRIAPLLVALVIVLGIASRATAQSSYVTFVPATFSYPWADPDSPGTLDTPPITVLYKMAGLGSRGIWTITISATDLVCPGNPPIPVGQTSWTATPAPLAATGQLSTTEKIVATGSSNITKEQTASFTFHLINSWTYNPGTYTQTITITVTSQ